MKTLKFVPHLVDKILSGEKTSTWRLFDDKDLKTGDKLVFINKETGKQFGTATITSLKVKTLDTLTDDDWIERKRFSSEKEMYRRFQRHYKEKVGKDSEVKMLTFDFKK